MALSDCIKCWETPCSCGHEYETWSRARKLEIIRAIVGTDKTLIDDISKGQCDEPVE